MRPGTAHSIRITRGPVSPSKITRYWAVSQRRVQASRFGKLASESRSTDCGRSQGKPRARTAAATISGSVVGASAPSATGAPKRRVRATASKEILRSPHDRKGPCSGKEHLCSRVEPESNLYSKQTELYSKQTEDQSRKSEDPAPQIKQRWRNRGAYHARRYTRARYRRLAPIGSAVVVRTAVECLKVLSDRGRSFDVVLGKHENNDLPASAPAHRVSSTRQRPSRRRSTVVDDLVEAFLIDVARRECSQR